MLSHLLGDVIYDLLHSLSMNQHWKNCITLHFNIVRAKNCHLGDGRDKKLNVQSVVQSFNMLLKHQRVHDDHIFKLCVVLKD